VLEKLATCTFCVCFVVSENIRWTAKIEITTAVVSGHDWSGWRLTFYGSKEALAD